MQANKEREAPEAKTALNYLIHEIAVENKKKR